MKKSLGLAIVLVLAAGTANAATILGSAHDLSGRGWGTTELCRFCHVAHNGATGFIAPLWNHQITAAAYTTYASPTMNSTVGQPGDYSKACLSCHDGTVAIDSYTGRTGTNFMTGGALMGTNLTNDHPVGITYDAALATTDGGLFNPTTTQSGLGGTIAATMLFAGKMECASCHDVHDPALGNFLRKTNASSALCLTCHNK